MNQIFNFYFIWEAMCGEFYTTTILDPKILTNNKIKE